MVHPPILLPQMTGLDTCPFDGYFPLLFLPRPCYYPINYKLSLSPTIVAYAKNVGLILQVRLDGQDRFW